MRIHIGHVDEHAGCDGVEPEHLRIVIELGDIHTTIPQSQTLRLGRRAVVEVESRFTSPMVWCKSKRNSSIFWLRLECVTLIQTTLQVTESSLVVAGRDPVLHAAHLVVVDAHGLDLVRGAHHIGRRVLLLFPAFALGDGAADII